jgi:hypothetical protein
MSSHNIMTFMPDNVVRGTITSPSCFLTREHLARSENLLSFRTQAESGQLLSRGRAIYSPSHRRETGPILEDKGELRGKKIAICDEIAFHHTKGMKVFPSPVISLKFLNRQKKKKEESRTALV